MSKTIFINPKGTSEEGLTDIDKAWGLAQVLKQDKGPLSFISLNVPRGKEKEMKTFLEKKGYKVKIQEA